MSQMGRCHIRFRISTLMLLIVIAALCVVLLVQHERASRREADLQDQLEETRYRYLLLERSTLRHSGFE
jgi:cell division protein FtsL